MAPRFDRPDSRGFPFPFEGSDRALSQGETGGKGPRRPSLDTYWEGPKILAILFTRKPRESGAARR